MGSCYRSFVLVALYFHLVAIIGEPLPTSALNSASTGSKDEAQADDISLSQASPTTPQAHGTITAKPSGLYSRSDVEKQAPLKSYGLEDCKRDQGCDLECFKRTGKQCGSGQFVVPLDVANNASPRDDATLEKQLEEQCVLWDDTCSGNKTEAERAFFHVDGPRNYLAKGNNTCFHEDKGCSSGLKDKIPKLKDYMRSELCQFTLNNRHSGLAAAGGLNLYDRTCCNKCAVLGNYVQVYYWPELDADTSCLSIIGDTVLPVDYGATTDGTNTYWGCATGKILTHTSTSVWHSDHTTFMKGSYHSTTWGVGERIRSSYEYVPDTTSTSEEYFHTLTTFTSMETITTATVKTENGLPIGVISYGHGELNSLTYKEYLINPWSATPCPEGESTPTSVSPQSTFVSSAETKNSAGLRSSLHVTAQSLVPTNKWTNGTRINTAVSGSYTLYVLVLFPSIRLLMKQYVTIRLSHVH